MPYNFTPSMDAMESVGSRAKAWLNGWFYNLTLKGALAVSNFATASHNYGALHADWTLSTDENRAIVMVATNANQAVNAIGVPTFGAVYIVYNNTGYNLTYKAAGQTGVTIPNGGIVMVMSNTAGTDFVSVSTSITALGSGATLTDVINNGFKRVTAEVDRTSSTVLTAITGLSISLTAAGVYAVHGYIPGTSGATGGVRLALGSIDTLTATSFSGSCRIMNGTTIVADGTTTTFGNTMATIAAVYTYGVFDAVIVVNAAGTLVAQIGQNTSDAGATSAYVNGFMSATRIA